MGKAGQVKSRRVGNAIPDAAEGSPPYGMKLSHPSGASMEYAGPGKRPVSRYPSQDTLSRKPRSRKGGLCRLARSIGRFRDGDHRGTRSGHVRHGHLVEVVKEGKGLPIPGPVRNRVMFSLKTHVQKRLGQAPFGRLDVHCLRRIPDSCQPRGQEFEPLPFDPAHAFIVPENGLVKRARPHTSKTARQGNQAQHRNEPHGAPREARRRDRRKEDSTRDLHTD